MAFLLRIWDGILDGMMFVAALLTLALTLGVCADVVLRTLGTGGVPWMFDAAEYVLLALLALGTTAVLRDQRHINVDLFIGQLPPRGRRATMILGKLLCFLVAAALTHYATIASLRSFNDGSLIFRYLIFPEWIPFAGVAVTFALLTVESFRQTLRAIFVPLERDAGRADMF